MTKIVLAGHHCFSSVESCSYDPKCYPEVKIFFLSENVSMSVKFDDPIDPLFLPKVGPPCSVWISP